MSFTREFSRLNQAQKKAVQTIEGPLLVVAGPGTGKTQLLAMRVANILNDTDVSGTSILCLTFTNKASVNMRQRILDLTDHKASDVTVKTFHSFAAEIMSLYPDHFWNGARLSLAPDALQLEIVQDILKSLPFDNPLALKFAGKFTLTNDVINALKLVKEAGLTPDKLRSIIRYNLKYIESIEEKLVEITNNRLSAKQLPRILNEVKTIDDQEIDRTIAPLVSLSTVIKESLEHAVELDTELGKTINTSNWKKRWIQNVDQKKGMHQERKRNEWWLELADVYEQYRNHLHNRGYYDYADMLVEVISQLENNADMRADVQERFLYVMIDEFQDTNPAQLRLAHLVSDHHTQEGNPNLMAVGDDDQSIFKFNGAELNNMLSFRRTYPNSNTIVLTENYRSTQTILDVASKVINTAQDRLVIRDKSLNKQLHANITSRSTDASLLKFRDRETQLSTIAKQIKEIYTPSASLAVIARGHASLRELASRLQTIGVPIHYEQQRNILEHPLVQHVILLGSAVHALANGDREMLNSILSHTLRHPMWGISTHRLWEIALENYTKADWLNSIKNSKDLNWLNEWLMEMSQLSTTIPLGLFAEYLLGLRETTSGRSPINAFYSSNKANPDQYISGLSAIQLLRRMADEYSNNSSANLADFLQLIQVETENEKIINDESPLVTGSHAVSLLTVHKSKGLEFDHVFIIDAIESNWSPRIGGRKPPSNLPLQPAGDDMDDYVRLMYVAVTRARYKLTVSYFDHDSAGNDLLPSTIISSALEIEQPAVIADPIDIIRESILWPELKQNDMLSVLKPRMQDYSLSVTHLLNFLDVTKGGPQYFLERNLLRIPEPKTISLAFGTAMHDALEIAQRLTNKNRFDLAAVIKKFEESLNSQHMPEGEIQRHLKHGPKVLTTLLENNMLHLEPGSMPEQRIKDVYVDNARLNGTLDTLNVGEESLLVTDYKTGRPLRSFDTKDQNLQIKAWKQKTQLIYYALLLKHAPAYVKYRDKQVVGQMTYLEATSPNELNRKYIPSTEDIDNLETLIKKVWDKIIHLDLPKTDEYEQSYLGIQKFIADLIII